MSRLFDDNLYRFETPQQSYWEATARDIVVDAKPLDGTESCDVAVIGGGYTGLSAALHLARDFDVDVRVLEAGHIGWGASGRNGGFCAIGGTALAGKELIRFCGADNAREYYQSQVAAVELVRSLATDESLDYRPLGEAEVLVAHTERSFAGFEAQFDTLKNVLGMDASLFGRNESRQRYYDSTEQFGALSLGPAFGLYPLRYCKGLANAAIRRGARLHPRSEVVAWTREDNGTHRITTRSGSLRARKVVFATNGFMPENLHASFYGRTMPVTSAIIVTRPLTDDEIAAQGWVTTDVIYTSRRILNYFRLLPDKRFLFGGRGNSHGSIEGELASYRKLEELMGRFWPAWAGVDVEYCWHGLVCMNASLCPSIGKLDDDESVFFGYGYHGSGVSAASWTGKMLAEWIGKGRPPAKLPAVVRGLGKRYPLPGLRSAYFKVLLAAANWLDRRS